MLASPPPVCRGTKKCIKDGLRRVCPGLREAVEVGAGVLGPAERPLQWEKLGRLLGGGGAGPGVQNLGRLAWGRGWPQLSMLFLPGYSTLC